jgi:acyl carrier protein/ribosomal protein S13
MQITEQQIQTTILNLLEEMTQDWDLELDGSISLTDKLIANLNFSSVDFVQLFVAIEDEFGQKLGFHELIMPDDKYVDDLSAAQIVSFVEQKLNSKAETKKEETAPLPTVTAVAGDRLNAAKVERFKQSIPTPPKPNLNATDKNPPAIFVFSPSRSGSTLLRVMLAGHPQLFVPPELHLLYFESLQIRKTALSNELNLHLLKGTIQALAELQGSSIETAEKIMAEYEERNLSTKEFYRVLQESLGERILVDKTPSIAYHVDLLRQAEAQFSDPLYIHLVRHPYATIRSFENAKMDRLLPFMQSIDFSRREYAELAWLVCHQNILELLQDIPQNRQIRVRFEDLVGQPQTTIEKICNFLNLDFHSDMLEPYKDKERRMTDGVENVANMSGDLKFYLHKDIEAETAYRWQKYHTVDFLSDMSLELAKSLGYTE